MTWWWSQLLLKFTLIGTVVLCRFYRPPRAPTAFDNFTHTLIFVSTFWSAWSRIAEVAASYVDMASMAARMDIVMVNNVNMIVTVVSFLWLLFRSWQTLSTPVPVLIKTLHVEVPEAPDVSLSSILSDAATLQWTRPSHNRTVMKYFIQVNGVNVGESAAQETAITVTGLKPGHFYNIRVIAVGYNNFQVPGSVIRLQTYDVEGRPIMASDQLPTSFRDSENKARYSTGNDRAKPTVTAVEAIPEPPVGNVRDLHGPAQRRNTLNRKPSPSVTSSDQPALRDIVDEPDVSLEELNAKFERTRREIEDTIQQYAREEEDFRQQEAGLKAHLAEKRRINRERDLRTDMLRKEMKSLAEAKRSADKEKGKRETLLREKQVQIEAIHTSITKLEAGAKDMRAKRAAFEKERNQLDEDHQKKMDKLNAENTKLHEECTRLEAELKQKGKTVKAMRIDRQKNTEGSENESAAQAHAKKVAEKEATKRELESTIKLLTTEGHELEVQLQNIRMHNEHYMMQHQQQLPQQPPMSYYNQPSSVAIEFEQQAMPVSNQVMHRSRHGSNNMAGGSPSMSFPIIEAPYSLPSYPQSNGFPFMDITAVDEGPYGPEDSFTPSEYQNLSSGPPLSPTATSLLPSGILGDFGDLTDDEPPEVSLLSQPADPTVTPPSADSHSPAISNRSPSLLSSPHGSSSNLPFPTLGTETPDRLMRTSSREAAPAQPQHARLSSLFNFPRHHTRPSNEDMDFGTPLGSLRPSQSQSLPRKNDLGMGDRKPRKTAFGLFTRNTIHTDSSDVFSMGSNGSRLSSRLHNPFSASGNLGLGGVHERVPSSPRPSSIASAELPRPSTDSGSLWGSGDNGVGSVRGRPWPTDGNIWNSRGTSRRTSVHGTNPISNSSTVGAPFATDDDDILDEHDLQNLRSAHKVGVIGSRPSNAQSMSPGGAARLNPKAPTFMTSLFRKDDRGDGRSRARDSKGGRYRDSDRDHSPSPYFEQDDFLYDPEGSPTSTRKSRDMYSLQLQNSIPESHESLSMDSSMDGHQDNNGLMKIFRKGSSGRFSLSSRLSKDNGGLFKKGPGSTSANSERNGSIDARSSIGDGEDGYDETAVLSSSAGTGTGSGMGMGMGMGYSAESLVRSPSLSSSKGKDKESRMTSWRFSMSKKKDKASIGGASKESLDMDRDRAVEVEAEAESMIGGGDAQR